MSHGDDLINETEEWTRSELGEEYLPDSIDDEEIEFTVEELDKFIKLLDEWIEHRGGMGNRIDAFDIKKRLINEKNALLEQDEPSDNDEIKKEIDKDYIGKCKEPSNPNCKCKSCMEILNEENNSLEREEEQ